jgi:hypothetical protein
MLVRQSVFGLPRRKQVRDSLRAIIAPRINGHEILPVGSVASHPLWKPKGRNCRPFRDGASRTRTGDLLGAIQALSQLSYSPAEGKV